MRLFLSATHLLYREALLFQLLLMDELTLAGEASNGVETLARLGSANATILVIEENLLDNDGLTISEIALQKDPDLIILLLVDAPITQKRLSIYLEAGIKSVISKQQPISDLVRALHYLHSGQIFVDPQVISSVKPSMVQKEQLNQLSEREREVAEMIASRVAIKDIADQLGVSNKTVHTYKDRVLVKLGLERIPELIVFVNRYFSA